MSVLTDVAYAIVMMQQSWSHQVIAEDCLSSLSLLPFLCACSAAGANALQGAQHTAFTS